jgi:hypothetical protein
MKTNTKCKKINQYSYDEEREITKYRYHTSTGSGTVHMRRNYKKGFQNLV